MADVLNTTTLDLANHTKKGIWQKNIKAGVLAQLAVEDPEIKVGSTDIFAFTDTPKAELVGESAQKSSQSAVPTKVEAKTYKVHVTYRMSDEVLYEDEDYQLGLIDALVGRIATAISRALDLIGFHGINPATGTVSNQVVSYIDKANFLPAANVKTATASANADVEALASALQAAGYNATGIALDPEFAGTLARSKTDSGTPLYPELGLGFDVTRFQGLTAASSDTVSGKREMAAAAAVDQAIMGDFNAFKWGIARQVGLETIRYGDPDGNGDLKRKNEIAIRAEAYFGFAFMDPNAFALLKKASA